MFKRKHWLITLGIALTHQAGAGEQELGRNTLEEILITADRIDSALVAPTRQITLLDREETLLRAKAGGTLAELLSSAVPGLAPASQTPSEFSLMLRGRNFLTLIDGIPMAPSRNVNRNLTNLHVREIENVEVISGGNAIYGSGATGGVVALTTLQPTREHRQSSYVEAVSSLTHAGGDSLGVEFNQAFTGTFEAFDYVLSVTRGESGANFDADGDRIAPEVSQGDLFEADTFSVLAKIGKNLDAERRLQLSVSSFDLEQDSDHGSDTSVLEAPIRAVDARAVPGLELSEQNEFKNRLLNLEYFDNDIAGSTLHGQLYYRDHETRFYPFDARAFATWRHLVQTYLQSEIGGGRLTLRTPLEWLADADSELVWGADFEADESEAPVTTYDGETFDASGGLVFIDAGDKVHMPPINTSSRAVFVQYRSRLTDAWSWEAGGRFQWVEVDFDDFVTLPQTLEPDPVVTPGGSLAYDEWMFNIALAYTPDDHHEFYAAFNQGFDQPDIGLQVRNARPGFNINGSNLSAITTDNYELGWRGNWDGLSASLAAYYSTSDLGGVSTVDFGLTLSRTSERIRGVEASLDYVFNSRWSGGIDLGYVEGEEKPSGSSWRDMNGFRIPPLQVGAYLVFQPNANWYHRLQFSYVDSEDYRLDGAEGFGRRTVDSYWTVDFTGRYRFGGHSIQAGVENLFNEDYKTLYGQLLRSSSNQSHIPARGATLRVGYAYDW